MRGGGLLRRGRPWGWCLRTSRLANGQATHKRKRETEKKPVPEKMPSSKRTLMPSCHSYVDARARMLPEISLLALGMQETPPMGRYLIILVALLCFISSAAFFFYVPVLPVLAT